MHQRKISFRTWRWCGLVCTHATTKRWTPVALNTSLQVWMDTKHHCCSASIYSLCACLHKQYILQCHRRDQGREGVRFPQLDPVLPSGKKRKNELLQPQLQWPCKHPQDSAQWNQLYSNILHSLSLPPAHSGPPTLTWLGCSLCGMDTTSRSALPSLVAAPSLTLPYTASATSLVLESSEYICVSCNVSMRWTLFGFRSLIVFHL